MRVLFSSLGASLLGVLLLCQHVHGASKTGHAAECVLAYMAYRLEGLALGERPYNDPEYRLAKECASSSTKQRCNFNQFLTYITRGSSSGQPAALSTASGDLDVRDNLLVENTIKGLAQSSDPGIEAMVQNQHRVDKILADAGGSFNKLYHTSYPKFFLGVHERIQNMPGGTPKDDAVKIWDNAQRLIANIARLRQGEADDAMWSEMGAEFDGDGQNPHYVYFHKDEGKTVDLMKGRPVPLEPIKWVEKKASERTFAGLTWHSIDVNLTKEQNKQTYADIRPAILGWKDAVEHTWIITWLPSVTFGGPGLMATINDVLTMQSMIYGGIGRCGVL